MPLPDSVAELVARFEASRNEYHKGPYNETQTRIDYVNPLFAALGWDMSNRYGLPELLREVVHEDAIKIGGTTKAPDYSFRIGGARKFFVETKKPTVHLYLIQSPAFQLRRYGWTVKMPLSILTNFEEFAIYDTRVPPNKKDAAKTARLDYFKFTEYADRWDAMQARFSHDAVLSGAFDLYAEQARDKRISVPVDVAFLSEISGWREKLARNIVVNNPGLSPRELNYAVQMIIDRLIFLRISEDRGVEPHFLLQPLMNRGGPVYPRLLDIFRRADARYNSGLFHFQTEPRRQGPDDVTPRLTVDDRPLREIIASIYYPESPFEFSVFPADTLGQVYEQFLGQVIHVSGKTATVEAKPEVKKAGGVYYTPTYIVRYIVENTVGKLVEGKTPAQVAKLTILDPACGSGSFLIGAYQFLLDWHLKYYTENDRAKWARGKSAPIYQFKKDVGGEELWRLTTAEKKRILLANLYGVDIDTQAVEVTKLSLLLKVLEGESAELIDNTLRLLHERALPDLESNIKCGNSLIGPDFYADKKPEDFDMNARLKINAFAWEGAFPKVMADGGFDAVIGNPPYLSYSGRQAVMIPQVERDHLFAKFSNLAWPTAHAFFIELAIGRLSKRFTSFIVPDQVGHLPGYQVIRDKAVRLGQLQEVRYWGEKVFVDVVTPALTFVVDKVKQNVQTRIYAANGTETTLELKAGQSWAPENNNPLMERISESAGSLGKLVADPGVHTGNISKKLILPEAAATDDSVPVLEGRQITRYQCQKPDHVLRLNYKPEPAEYFAIRPLKKYQDAHYVIRQTANHPIVGPREGAHYFRNSLLALYDPQDETDVRYLVGLLNSSLLRYVYTKSVQESQQKAFPQVKVASLRRLPIHEIDFADPDDKARHDKMVRLVEQMLKLHKTEARLGQEKAMWQQQINATDAQIDRLVYDLYGLTEDEIKIVEAAG